MTVLRRKGLPLAAKLSVTLAVVTLIVWVCGQYWTDEYHLTQYFWWIPTHWALGMCWLLVAISWILERLSLRLGGFQLRSLVTCALLILSVWMIIGSWKIYRLVLPTSDGDLRVLFWNMTVGRDMVGAPELILAEKPDLAVIANPRFDGLRGRLLEGLRELAHEPGFNQDSADTSQESGLDVGHTRFLLRDEIAVATRGRIVRWGRVSFQFDNTQSETHRAVVLYVEVADLAPEPIVVWIVDLPSHPLLWRSEVTAQTRRALAEWNGPEHHLTPLGQWEPRVAAFGFPEPDIILGDFNIPRRSASLKTLVGNRVESHAARGWGLGATWSRSWPGWAIDMLFAGSGWSIARHRVVDPGMGMHRMIVVDLKAE